MNERMFFAAAVSGFDSDDDLPDHMASQLELEGPLHALRGQRIAAMHMHSQTALFAESLEPGQVSATAGTTAITRQVNPEEHATAREEIHPEEALHVCEEPVHGTTS